MKAYKNYLTYNTFRSMVAQRALSYGQLYQLFGYRKALDLEAIIEELLFSISVTEYSPAVYSFSGLAGDSLTPAASPMPYHVFKKENLPEYLSHKTPLQNLYRMDARMRVIQLIKKELKLLSWYQISKWIKLHIELRKLCSPLIPIKEVFSFCAYKASKMGLSPAALHAKMKDRAESYSGRIFGLWALD